MSERISLIQCKKWNNYHFRNTSNYHNYLQNYSPYHLRTFLPHILYKSYFHSFKEKEQLQKNNCSNLFYYLNYIKIDKPVKYYINYLLITKRTFSIFLIFFINRFELKLSSTLNAISAPIAL